MLLFVVAGCTIQFTLSEKYPDEAPVIEITEYSNLEEGQIEELITYLNEQVSLCVYMHVCVCVWSEMKLQS